MSLQQKHTTSAIHFLFTHSRSHTGVLKFVSLLEMLCPGAESVQVIYEHTAHLQAIYYTHPSHSLSLASPAHESCFSSSTKLLCPTAFEHLSNINEHILTRLPRGMWILSPCREDLPMAMQSVAELGMGPRNLVLQPRALTTVLFLCSLL